MAVLGDASIEGDETFGVGLSALVNATAGDLQGSATIVDDDAPSLSRLELAHGSTQWGDLATDPGPLADVDFYPPGPVAALVLRDRGGRSVGRRGARPAG